MKINQELIAKCKDTKLQLALGKLIKLNQYYSLLSGDIVSYVKIYETLGKVPNQLKEWLKIFDGGFLFSVSMFSTKHHIENAGTYLTFEEINSDEFKKKNDIPDNVVCFAMANYGNYYFFEKDTEDESIYEWDVEEKVVIQKWDSFSEWLNTQIDNAEADLKDGLLVPMED